MSKNSFSRLVDIVKILRGEKGCPWDKKQKIGDLKNYLLEEVYELSDVLEKKNYDSIKEEIGDLFFLLVFLSFLFEEKKIFGVKDVLEGVVRKMIIRHPHVFSSSKLKSAEDVLSKWVKFKSVSKKRSTLAERIPWHSPSLFSSFLLLKELKALGKVSKKELEKKLFESISRFKKSKKKVFLLDLLFYSSLILSYSRKNPEFLLRERVRKEASNFFYHAPDRKKE